MIKLAKNYFFVLISSQGELFSGSLIMIFGSFFTSFINYLYHLIMGRMLEPANYGSLASIISLVGLLSLVSASVGLVVTKIVASSKGQEEINEKVYALNKHVWLVGAIFFGLLLSLSGVISQFLIVNHLLLVIGLAVLLLSFPTNLVRSTLQGLMKFKLMVVSQTLENILRLGGAVALVNYGLSVAGGLWGLFLGTCAGWLIGWIFVRRFLIKPKKMAEINFQATLKSSLPFLMLSISITSLYSSDLILVKHFFSSFDAGIYAAMSFLGRVIFFGVSPITAVMFPLVVRNRSNGEGSLPVLSWSLFGGVAIALVVTLLYWLSPDFVISQLYGEKYLRSSSLLVFFGIFMTFVTLSFLLLNYELASGRRRVVLVSLLAAMAQIILIWFYHPSLMSVVFISVLTSLWLLIYLLFDSFYLNFGGKK